MERKVERGLGLLIGSGLAVTGLFKLGESISGTDVALACNTNCPTEGPTPTKPERPTKTSEPTETKEPTETAEPTAIETTAIPATETPKPTFPSPTVKATETNTPENTPTETESATASSSATNTVTNEPTATITATSTLGAAIPSETAVLETRDRNKDQINGGAEPDDLILGLLGAVAIAAGGYFLFGRSRRGFVVVPNHRNKMKRRMPF